jgi:hypothetical protein
MRPASASLAVALALACAVEPVPSEPDAPAPPAPPPPTHLLGAEAGSLTLRERGGGPPLDLSPTVALERADRPIERARIERWEPRDGELRGEVSTRSAAWSLRVRAADPVEIEVELTMLEGGAVERAWVEWSLPGAPAHILDRAYREQLLEERAVLGAWTPQLVRVGELGIVGHGLALAAEPEEAATRVELILEHSAEHPLLCWPKGVTDPLHVGTRRDRSRWTAQAGERRSARLQLYPQLGPVPLPLRFPAAYHSALVITDHGDHAERRRLEALMYGASSDDPEAPPPPPGSGFAGRGLSMTKTIFPLRDRQFPAQLDDPHFAPLLDRMVADGVEIGPHSASGGPDEVDAIRRGLALLEPWGAVTWIDHLPASNPEAIIAEGLEGGRWDAVTPLVEHGYRYLWSGHDVSRGINLLDPGEPSEPRPVLYQHPLLPERFWLFPSTWRAMPRAEFLRAYRAAELDRLVEERGLHIAHTYLDIHVSFSKRMSWTLLERTRDGFVLAPEVDAFFAELARRQDEGGIWVAGIRDVADHMRAVRQLHWEVRGNSLVLRSEQPVRDLGLLVPASLGTPRLDGQPLERGPAGWRLDLPAGEPRELVFEAPITPTLRVSLAGAPGEPTP